MTAGTTSAPTSSQGATRLPPRRMSRATLFMYAAGAGLGAALLLMAILLWAQYGAGVFYDIMSAGLATCL